MGLFNFNKKIKLKNTDEIMTTLINKNVKLETKIEIPDNYVGLVYYHDYFQFSLPAGTHTMHKDSFYQIVKKNEKKNKASKKPTFNFNIHYVSLNDMEMEIAYQKKNKSRQKVNCVLAIKFKIDQAETFAKEILATSYRTTTDRTSRYLHDWFKQFASKVNFKNITDKQKLIQSATKFFKNYGISILDVSLKTDAINRLYSDNSNDNSHENMEIASFSSSNNTSSLNDSQNNMLPNNSNNGSLPQNVVQQNVRFCPRCQSKLLDGSTYCLRCGFKVN